MIAERIDFISAYCDSWCDRCAFTDRCSAFACQAAAAMCGDFAEGLELAVGTPQPVDGEEREPTAGERLMAEMFEHQPSAEEMAKIHREEDARRARVDAAALTAMARDYMRRATSWLDRRRDDLTGRVDPVAREALDIVGWDAYLVGAKLHRALSGRDRSRHGDDWSDDHPVQNDWNGSAKVALISLQRSEAAWRVIADATADTETAALADAVGALHRTASDEFPNAMSFVRPGFDEPGR
jgi:hypothetical protein